MPKAVADVTGTSCPDDGNPCTRDACDGGWEIDGEPYTRASGTRFDWWRGRMLGGRTNHWGRISLRFGPEDFRGKTRDGLGDDWPIGYQDLAPFYDQVDDLIGVFGSKEGIHNEPDGKFLPPMGLSCAERQVKTRVKDTLIEIDLIGVR